MAIFLGSSLRELQIFNPETKCNVSPYLAAIVAAVALALGQPALTAPPVESVGWQPRDIRYPGLIRLHVDATDVDRGIFRVSRTVPVKHSGPLTLLFPKWVPLASRDDRGSAARPLPIAIQGVLMRVGEPRPW